MEAETINLNQNDSFSHSREANAGVPEFHSHLKNLLQLMKSKCHDTHAHLGRVFLLAEEWGLWLLEQNKIVPFHFQNTLLAALLHDVGKVGVLDEVLGKPGPLTGVERAHLELHSEIGYEMVREVRGLERVATILRHHHERWDGKGYPIGLRANDIPVESRIIAIIDAFDAMTNDRVYRKAMDGQQAIAEIHNNAHSQFCPVLSPLFVEFMRFKYTVQECPGLMT